MKATRKAKGKRCNICGAAETLARGCCRNCYTNARRAILRGDTDEAELVRRGLWNAKSVNHVREALARAR